VARHSASHLFVTIASDEPALAAVVAVNLALIATDEARRAIVIDADSAAGSVSTALGTHRQPGTADLASGRNDWPNVISPITLGRGRVIDIVPAGSGPASSDALIQLFRSGSGWLSRHYDAILVVATLDQACEGLPAALPLADTIICARAGHTRLDGLVTRLAALHEGAANLLGVVVWDAPMPVVRTASRAVDLNRSNTPIATPRKTHVEV
jgi:Mrp family chromosome partitioning ATPase